MEYQQETVPEPQVQAPSAIEQYINYPFATDADYQVGICSWLVLQGRGSRPTSPPYNWPHVCFYNVVKQGLGNIMLGWSLEQQPSAETRAEMLRRTRVFYFNKCVASSS